MLCKYCLYTQSSFNPSVAIGIQGGSAPSISEDNLGSQHHTLCVSGGGPESLSALIEGESLFNDATSIVLFDIFLDQVRKLSEGEIGTSSEGIGAVIGHMILGICWLAAGGALIGIAFGAVTQ